MADTKTMIERAYSAFIRALVSAIQIFLKHLPYSCINCP
jgi:hypothetical protein